MLIETYRTEAEEKLVELADEMNKIFDMELLTYSDDFWFVWQIARVTLGITDITDEEITAGDETYGYTVNESASETDFILGDLLRITGED